MGEDLPYRSGGWTIATPGSPCATYPAKRRFGIICGKFPITTSGNFRTPTLLDAIMELGADRIMFSTDWPFENIDHARQLVRCRSICEADRLKIGRTNARLFKLGND